jgi:hypothetical protein
MCELCVSKMSRPIPKKCAEADSTVKDQRTVVVFQLLIICWELSLFQSGLTLKKHTVDDKVLIIHDAYV